MNMFLDLKHPKKKGKDQTKVKMSMAGNCIDLSENVTIHLQFSDFENEDHVSFVENIFPFLSRVS